MENADLVIKLDLNKRRTKVINGKTAENGLRVDSFREIKTKARDKKKKTRKKMKNMRKMENICLKRKYRNSREKKVEIIKMKETKTGKNIIHNGTIIKENIKNGIVHQRGIVKFYG